jgi:predicted acylesterase/phospholipase RssA
MDRSLSTSRLGTVNNIRSMGRREEYHSMFKELVIGSGGVYMVHKMGALRGLDRICPIDSFSYYTGCSAGSILSLLIVLGYTVEEMVALMETTDFAEKMNLKVKGFLENYGLDDGMGFYHLFRSLLERKGFDPHLTFLELYTLRPKILTFCVANLTRGEAEYHNLFTTPQLRVIDSLLMSMHIPFLLKPIRKTLTYKGKLQKNHIYVDGALYDPFPYRIMKRVPPHQKLGIYKMSRIMEYTEDQEEDPYTSPFMESFSSYAMHIVASVMNHHTRRHYRFLFEEKYVRNIYCIPETISPIEFSMDPLMKMRYLHEHDVAFTHFYKSLIRKNYLAKKYMGIWYTRMKG